MRKRYMYDNCLQFNKKTRVHSRNDRSSEIKGNDDRREKIDFKRWADRPIMGPSPTWSSFTVTLYFVDIKSRHTTVSIYSLPRLYA